MMRLMAYTTNKPKAAQTAPTTVPFPFQFLGTPAENAATHRVVETPYHGVKDSLSAMDKMARDGQSHPQVRRYAEEVIRQVYPKDYLSELAALYYDVCRRIRYTRDPAEREYVQHPAVILENRAADCFPQGTLFLNDQFEFVPVEKVTAGTRIWGRDRWSTVENVWYKGVLPVDAVRLNNGSWLTLTADHKVYVARCSQHVKRNKNAATGKKRTACACPVESRTIERVTVAELQLNDVLIAPEKLPHGTCSQDPRFAYLDGLYLADGWCQPRRVCISGKDGHPKEAQKREVAEICERVGLKTRWDARYIEIKDADLTKRMSLMGTHAANKCAPTINLDEAAARELLRGIMADSGKNSRGSGRTFTATSRMLALQTRVLHKMFGLTCGYSYIEHHGGLGQHPIHRLTVRVPQDERKGGTCKLLRVAEIQRGVAEAPVWDVSTDDHYVYLPEADVTVSNCDDQAVLLRAALGALGLSIGNPVEFVTIGFDASAPYGRRYTHVFVRAFDSKTGQWVVVDPVAGPNTREMLKKAKVFAVKKV